VSAGANNSCALTNAGAVLCWGVASRLGNGSTVNSSRPVGVTGLSSGVSAISAGGDHVCALTNGGAVVCWGNNTYGGLGDGTGIASSTPVPVVGLSSGVASISSGARHTCAVTAAGGVWCWGYNAYGELGDGTTTNGLVPVPVAGLSSGVSAVAAGGFHSCAITTAGATVCWGQNVYGQLGDGTTTDSPTPVAAFGLSAGTAAVTGGTYHTCAITTAGEARCWGSNNTGQIGDGTLVNRSVPTTVSGLSSGVVRISGGRGSTCAVTTTGRALCWGWNLYGQLGDGSTVNRLAPVTVAGYAK
jgi:alpha-tubulin suppressor-like RCC1 family protein